MSCTHNMYKKRTKNVNKIISFFSTGLCQNYTIYFFNETIHILHIFMHFTGSFFLNDFLN